MHSTFNWSFKSNWLELNLWLSQQGMNKWNWKPASLPLRFFSVKKIWLSQLLQVLVTSIFTFMLNPWTLKSLAPVADPVCSTPIWSKLAMTITLPLQLCQIDHIITASATFVETHRNCGDPPQKMCCPMTEHSKNQRCWNKYQQTCDGLTFCPSKVCKSVICVTKF